MTQKETLTLKCLVCWVDGRGSRLRFPVGASSPPRPEKLWTQTVSCTKGTNGSSLGVESPGHEADRSHPSSAEVKDCVELYFHSLSLQGVVFS